MAKADSEMAKLKKENKRLKSELQKAQSKNNSAPNWKKFGKWASLAIAGAVFVAGSILFYVGMTLTNTSRFMEVASPLIQQPAVQQAIAVKTTDALFSQVDVEQLAVEVLPDKADFLAPQISKQIEKSATSEAEKILASPKFQSTWDDALSTAHQKLITSLKNYEGDGTITLNDVFNRLASQLADTKLSFLAGKSLPASIGSITIIQSDYLPVAHDIVANINAARILTILVFIGLLALALYLSRDRRKAVIQIGILIALLSLVLLISLRIGRVVVSDQADPQFQQAAIETWNVLVNPYKFILWGQLLFGIALSAVAWIGGGSKAATQTKKRISILFEGKIHESLFRGKENNISKLFGKYRKYLLLLIACGYVLSFLFITISVSSVLIATIIAAFLAGIILTVAAPN